jgi:hypothetical protein
MLTHGVTITRATGDAATRYVRRQRLLTIAGGALGALAVWAVAEWVVGLDMRTPAFSSEQQPQELNAALVAVAGESGASLAGGCWRSSNDPPRIPAERGSRSPRSHSSHR